MPSHYHDRFCTVGSWMERQHQINLLAVLTNNLRMYHYANRVWCNVPLNEIMVVHVSFVSDCIMKILDLYSIIFLLMVNTFIQALLFIILQIYTNYWFKSELLNNILHFTSFYRININVFREVLHVVMTWLE